MNLNFAINIRKIREYKNAFYAVSLILIFAFSIAIAFAPLTSAQVGIAQPRTTAGYISVSPLVIGVGQQATVNAWVLPTPVNYFQQSTANSFSKISVTFTKPDGTQDTFLPEYGAGHLYPPGATDALGALFFYYAPNMAGNWSVTMTMPAQNFTDSTGTVQWTTCTSAPAYFTVTTEQQNAGILNGWPYSPFPTGYWSYPINSNNREWAAISGDFYGTMAADQGGLWQPYGSGPSSGHILWDSRVNSGGLMGGSYGSNSYGSYSGSALGPPTGAFICEGIAVVNQPAAGMFQGYDLTTGKLLYTQPGAIATVWHMPGNAYYQVQGHTSNQSGVALTSSAAVGIPYLFSGGTSQWSFYDPLTGQLRLRFVNIGMLSTYQNSVAMQIVDGTTIAYGQTYASYNPNRDEFDTNYLWVWNATLCTLNLPNFVLSGTSIEWKLGVVFNKTLNTPSKPGPGDPVGRTNVAMSADLSTIVVGPGGGGNIVEGINANTGVSIWNLTLPYATEAVSTQVYLTNDFIAFDPTHATWYCYSDLTGALLWSSPNVGIYPWNTKGLGFANDHNNIYVMGPDGTIAALSLATGNVVWQSTPMPSSEYSSNVISYWYNCYVIVGGVIYVYGGYSTGYQINPTPRFAVTNAINATTGKLLWTLNGGLLPAAASSGYLIENGIFDGNLYCIGKGQTSTSVSMPNSVTEGDKAQIQGNVLDQSPAQSGTPAVSDSSMSEQMDYLHMQNATLLNSGYTPQGVQVTLTAVDPNNNTITIGTTTTDSTGNFYLDWAPSMTGDYKITATFAGSGSYWSSHAETGVVVNSAPTSTSGTSTTTTSSGISATTFYTAVAAIIVVIIIAVIVLAILMLRKRP